MARVFSYTIASPLTAPPASVWAHASSMAGVNRELSPLLTMTYPRGYARLTAPHVRLGQRLFRSWLLLGGVVPIDYDDVTLIAVHDGASFTERSSMFAIAVWEHERRIRATVDGCVVTDRLAFKPRLPWTGSVVFALVRIVFRHRHQRLQHLFGVGTVERDAEMVHRQRE